jgi:hypothetical protein
MGSGSGIRDPGFGKNLFRIPDPGVKKATDPGYESATQPPVHNAHAASHECVRCTGKSTGSQVSDPGSGSATQRHSAHDARHECVGCRCTPPLIWNLNRALNTIKNALDGKT